jgi:hypothetical protein
MAWRLRVIAGAGGSVRARTTGAKPGDQSDVVQVRCGGAGCGQGGADGAGKVGFGGDLAAFKPRRRRSQR